MQEVPEVPRAAPAALHNYYTQDLQDRGYQELTSLLWSNSDHDTVIHAGIATALHIDVAIGDADRKLDVASASHMHAHAGDAAVPYTPPRMLTIADIGAGTGESMGKVLQMAGLTRPAAGADKTLRRPASGQGDIHPGEGQPHGYDGGNGGLEVSKAGSACRDETVWSIHDSNTYIRVLLVDPFLGTSSGHQWSDEIAVAPGEYEKLFNGSVAHVAQDCLGFLQDCVSAGSVLDRVLLKEVIHHVPQEQRGGLMRLLRGSLEPTAGRAVLITRLPEGQWPWFPRAAEAFQASCTDVAALQAEAGRIPGLRMAVEHVSVSVRLTVAQWCTLLRGRFWSHLAEMSQEEMEEGVAWVRRVHGSSDTVLEFCDLWAMVVVSVVKE